MKEILFFVLITTIFITLNSAEAKSSCPENTEWNGNNCIFTITRAPIIFTDYAGNAVVQLEQSEEKIVEDIIITAPKHEILRDLMIIEPEIIYIDDKKGVALEQKIKYDKQGPTNLDRSNYNFGKIIKWTTKNAESEFKKIVLGKHIQNSDFGKNDKHQVEYAKRYERYEDPVLQYNLIKENYRAQKIFLINWGDFTND